MEELKENELPGELVITDDWRNTFSYTSFDVELERAEGIYLYDTKGREYIDVSGGPAAIGLGHGEPRMAEAIAQQMSKFSYCHPNMASRPRADLCNAIAEAAPGDLNASHLVSGGSEAVETAIKLARQYHVERGDIGKYKIISRYDSYHGMTLATQALSGNPYLRGAMEPMLPQWPHIGQYSDYEKPVDISREAWGVQCARELEKVIYYAGEDTVAAFISTPNGNGVEYGVMAPDSYWKEIRRICDEYDVLLIADEVVTGYGRTGKWFGMEHFDIQADMMTTAKGMSSCYMPLGAVTVSDKINDVFKGDTFFIHGFTNGGHPLACVAGLTAINILKADGLVENSSSAGKQMFAYTEKLMAHPTVSDVRGAGLCMVIELVETREPRSFFAPDTHAESLFMSIALKNGVAFYSTLYGPKRSPLFSRGLSMLISPPLCITEAQVDEMMERMLKTLSEWEDMMQVG